MSIFDTIKNLLSSKGVNLPENLDTPEEIMAKGKELVAEHGDKLDQLKDKIPGDTDNNIIDSVKNRLN